MASAILFLLLALSMLAYISYPLLRRSQRNMEYVSDENEIELAEERDRAYRELETLDFEYECGKISGEDYQKLRQELLSKVESDSSETKSTTSAEQLKDTVEEEIAKYKAQRRP
jgi:hypothetical protein